MILSLSGGGIRGVMSAVILDRLDRDVPGWRNGVTLRVGTSTGGLLALGLANGMTPADMIEVYKSDGATIFADSIWDDIKDVGGLLGAKYDLDGLRATLTRLFGEKTLGQLAPVGVTAFDLKAELAGGARWKCKVFHNLPIADTHDDSVLARNAGLYTAAAPLYFPDADGYVDGGVWAGNPTIPALALAIRAGHDINTVRLLSIGTGRSCDFIDGENEDRGLKDYGTKIIDLLLSASDDAAEYMGSTFLADRFALWNTDSRWGMDENDAVPDMIEHARRESTAYEPIRDWVARG